MGKVRAWGYGSDSNVNSLMYLDDDAAKAIQDSKQSVSCPNCLVCGKNRKKDEICCGCVNIDFDYGYSGISKCQSCHKWAI